jgi:hypothetical protein
LSTISPTNGEERYVVVLAQRRKMLVDFEERCSLDATCGAYEDATYSVPLLRAASDAPANVVYRPERVNILVLLVQRCWRGVRKRGGGRKKSEARALRVQTVAATGRVERRM